MERRGNSSCFSRMESSTKLKSFPYGARVYVFDSVGFAFYNLAGSLNSS